MERGAANSQTTKKSETARGKRTPASQSNPIAKFDSDNSRSRHYNGDREADATGRAVASNVPSNVGATKGELSLLRAYLAAEINDILQNED